MVAARNDQTKVRFAARCSALDCSVIVVEGCWKVLIGSKDSDGYMVVAIKDLRLRIQITKQSKGCLR